MATRATIKLEGCNTAKVYKHWDGYPSATLPWLTEFNSVFTKRRGDDNDYKLAQLLRSSIKDAKKFKLDPSTDTGWGVVPLSTDCGEEYEYTLLKNGKVTYKEIK